MRFHTRLRRSPLINIVSLVDILCIVLIFFVVTTTFRREQPQIKLDLPASTQAKPAQQSTPEIITVAQDEKIYIGEKPISGPDLAAYLKKKMAADPSAKFALKASKKAPFQAIVQVMDATTAAGITELPTWTEENAAAAPASPSQP